MAEGDGRQVGWLDELVEQVRHWHDVALRTGGIAGERTARLVATCARPFQTAFGEEIFESDVEKAAALFHGIICNHPFADGNKRTAALTAILFLAATHTIDAAPSRLQIRMLGALAIEVASTRMPVEEVAAWLQRILDP